MASITSDASGDWSVGATWVGGIAPGIGDKVTIANGHTITVDTTGLGGGDDTSTGVNVNGVLKFSRAANSDLTVRGQLVIGATGEVDMGKEGDAITGVSAALKLNDSASMAIGKWGLNVANAGSKFYMKGAARKVRTKLTAAASASATSIQVADVTGWGNGDTIAIVGSTSSKTDSEIRTINGSITGTGPYTVPLSSGLSANHAAGIDVAHFNSNVTVQASNTTYRSYVNLKHGYGGTPSAGSVQVQNAAFRHIGAFGGAFLGLSIGQAAGATVASYAQWNEVSIYESQCLALEIVAMDYIARWKVKGLAVHASGHYLVYADNAGNWDMEDFVMVNTGANATWYGGNAAPTAARAIDGTFGPSQSDHLYQPMFNTLFERVRFMSCGTLLHPFDNQHTRVRFKECWLCNQDIGTPQGDYLYFMGFGKGVEIIFEDCLTDTTWTNSFKAQPTLPDQVVTWANYQQDPTAQEVYTAIGNIVRDNAVGFDSITPSERFAPFSNVTPLAQTFQILAPSGALVTVSGKIRQNFATAGAVRVTLSGLGIAPSVWLSAADAVNWQTFVVQGTQSSGATGLFTLTVETFNSSYSTSGTNKVWLDAIAAPAAVALNTGDIGVWFDGKPAALVTANYVTPQDVVTVMDASSTRLALAEKFNRNKLIADPIAGTITLYDDDDVTPLLSGALWKDAAGLIPYAGDGADRRDRLT